MFMEQYWAFASLFAYPLWGYTIYYTSNSVRKRSFFKIPSVSFNLQPDCFPKNRWSADITGRGERSTDNKKVSINYYLLSKCISYCPKNAQNEYKHYSQLCVHLVFVQYKTGLTSLVADVA